MLGWIQRPEVKPTSASSDLFGHRRLLGSQSIPLKCFLSNASHDFASTSFYLGLTVTEEFPHMTTKLSVTSAKWVNRPLVLRAGQIMICVNKLRVQSNSHQLSDLTPPCVYLHQKVKTCLHDYTQISGWIYTKLGGLDIFDGKTMQPIQKLLVECKKPFS